MSAGRVLVVDDEPIARENLVHALVRAGYEAEHAGDSRAALAELEKNAEAVLREAEALISAYPKQWAMFYSVWPEVQAEMP